MRQDERRDRLLRWLHSNTRHNGIWCLSEHKPYAHDENGYDRQYGIQPGDLKMGAGLVNLLKARDADFSLPALEVGCGTGALSLGLVATGDYPLILLTDPSAQFLDLLRLKLSAQGMLKEKVQLAVMKGDDLDLLPQQSLSLIAMHSALHHILDYRRFIETSAEKLARGGFLVFEEPCMEGYVLMSVLAQFLPAILDRDGIELNRQQLDQIDLLIRSTQFYSRRDIDKSQAEDKHLFRTEELMAVCHANGLDFCAFPNTSLSSCDDDGQCCNADFSFHKYFIGYLRFCMAFEDKLTDLFDRHLEPFTRIIDSMSPEKNFPHCCNVFVARKR